MFNKILVANRGEIAVRIIRACREMGIETVAVYSTADESSLHTELADETICIGPAAASKSYLNMDNIISAAIVTGAEAIHPGFGFLSENSTFARKCAENNIVFIGPAPEIIDQMGDKANARETMIKAGVPVVPGTEGVVKTADDGIKFASEIGYPVLIKASAGGGGRGMRLAFKEDEFKSAFETASMEALSAFGNGDVYIEKFVQNPRHIEIQILGDSYGNIIHLGERDCSMQRRNQKVIEESPSPFVDANLREKLGEAALKGARAVGYSNAGTMEFLVDKDKNFYFIEMNTRIQVEHPVTEMVTRIDLVKEQIRVAFGEKLRYKQEDVRYSGHAIECRINAEDPYNNFMPSAGVLEFINLPGGNGIRNETAVYSGYTIPPFYDSMIGKLISWGETREEAVIRMKRAIGEYIIQGITSNIDFQYELITSEEFISGEYDTGFIGRMMGAK